MRLDNLAPPAKIGQGDDHPAELRQPDRAVLGIPIEAVLPPKAIDRVIPSQNPDPLV